MAKLGIGVIGVGVMGARHAENLARRVAQARLVAVADTDRSRARTVAGKLRVAHVYASAEEVLARRDVDAVVIASPARFHAQAIIAAARAGKAILCEKPLALTLEDADTALAAVERAGVPLQIGFMRRYDPAYAEAKRRIEAGAIGAPLLFKAIGRDPAPPPPSYFRGGLSGGLFLDSSIHEFDLARWLMEDEVARVEATGGVLAATELAAAGEIDVGLVNLQFARGAVGAVESYRAARYGYDIRTEIVGSKGTIQIGFPPGGRLAVLKPAARPRIAQHFLERFRQAYLLEMRDFVVCVRRGDPPRVTGYDGRQALAVALAAERSRREARAVALDEFPSVKRRPG